MGWGVEELATFLALTGFLIGVVFRLKVLLPVLMIVFVGSMVSAIVQGASFWKATELVLLAQFIVQGAYFVGAVARWLFVNDSGIRSIF